MSGEFHGVQAYIRKKYNLALYSHCAVHSFNLAVSAACNHPQVKNCLGTIQTIYNFLNTPKRQIALQDFFSSVFYVFWNNGFFTTAEYIIISSYTILSYSKLPVVKCLAKSKRYFRTIS